MGASDLWVLVPSRGRPASVERLVRSCALTCTADTRLHFAFDDDDPDLAANIEACGHHRYTTGPRDGLTGWTNILAAHHVKQDDARALASLGDDHVPVTHGWDTLLLETIGKQHDGVGMAYPNDRLRTDIPEAVIISAPIVTGLGWMALPGTHHWCIDDAWRDLGAGAGCLSFCEQVIVEHRHWFKYAPDPTVTYDSTYADAAGQLTADRNAYRRWRLTGMRQAIGRVREIRRAAGIADA
jgi:hypothetical protein